MRINIILFNVVLLILLFVLIYLLININYNKPYEKFTAEASAFLDTAPSFNMNTQNIVNSTYNTTQFATDSIDMELQESIPVDTLGNGPGAAFDNVGDIMCQNRIVRLKGPSAGISYPNGYYWIQTGNGPKLTYLITNEEQKFGGGWALAIRAVLGSQTFNVIENINYRDWIDSAPTANSTSARLLGLPLRGTQSGWNASVGLNRFNSDFSEEFNISSVGNKIFNAITPPPPPGRSIFIPTETTTFTATYSEFDCKFPIFRIWLFKEILCIFYYISNGAYTTIRTYIKIPNRDLDSVSTLNRTLKIPNSTMTTINTFRTDLNDDLLYNFKMNIYNINGNPTVSTSTSIGSIASSTITPAATINCLFGCHGTIPADTTTGASRLRYLYAVGAALQNDRNRIKSSAVVVLVPDEITATNPIRYIPCGFEIFVK
jgi:hypothetical protein